jgi:Peptidase inhibitor family I36
MAKIAPTIRAGLMALGLMLGATAISGEAPGSQAIAGSRDPAPSANVTSVAARASCSFNRVCLWTGPNFTGRKTEVRPVPSGQCREIGNPASHEQASVANGSLALIRVWEFEFSGRCGGRNALIPPGRFVGRLGFGTAEGLGGF